MNNWADRSGEVFIKTKIVPADDKEILEYGISQGLFLVFNLLIFFGICCYFKIIIWGFIFLVLFWPLRIYAGGYHAKTRMHCILISTFMEIMACNIICKPFIKEITMICVAIISLYIIYELAPVDTEMRCLDIKERKIFRLKVHRLLLIESVFMFVAVVMKWKLFYKVIATALFLVATLLVSKRKIASTCSKSSDVR